MPTPENIAALDAAGKEQLLPRNVWQFLDQLQTEPHVAEAEAASMLQLIQQDMPSRIRLSMAHLQNGKSLNTLQVSPEIPLSLYRNFTKGILYAASQYEQTTEKSHLHNIHDMGTTRDIGTTRAVAENPDTCGICLNRPDGVFLGIFPNMLAEYNAAHTNPGTDRRIHEDTRMPGKYFNMAEMAFLLGVEMACHAQRMFTGRQTGQDDPEADHEILPILHRAVSELTLGSDVKESNSAKFADTTPRGTTQPASNDRAARNDGWKNQKQ